MRLIGPKICGIVALSSFRVDSQKIASSRFRAGPTLKFLLLSDCSIRLPFLFCLTWSLGQDFIWVLPVVCMEGKGEVAFSQSPRSFNSACGVCRLKVFRAAKAVLSYEFGIWMVLLAKSSKRRSDVKSWIKTLWGELKFGVLFTLWWDRLADWTPTGFVMLEIVSWT